MTIDPSALSDPLAAGGQAPPGRRFGADTLHFTYDAAHEPVGEVEPGEVFEIETTDCFSGRFQSPSGFTDENIAYTRENLDGVTGPVRVRGAAAGDAVAITLHTITITTPGSVVLSHCAGPSPDDWWDEAFACRSYPIENDEILFSAGHRIPVRPMIGCIATAPAREVVMSTRGGSYGGNMDCVDIGAGATVLLPTAVDGALLYFGDCKARMGAGEVVQPPEVGTLITASAELRPRPATMRWPRVETAEKLITVVTARTLDEACRVAYKELLDWFESDFAVSRVEAAQIMAMVADVGVCQVPNALPTAKCTMDRRWLGP